MNAAWYKAQRAALHIRSLHPAVAAPVTEINSHADDQPDDQADPCSKWKIRHQVARNQDSQNRHQRHHGSSEGTLKIRIATADDPHARTNYHESQQSSYIDHIAQQVNRQRSSQESDAGSDRKSGNPWRAESGMDDAEQSRQETVARHGKEDARLSQQHNHNGAAQTHERANFHHQTAPADSGLVYAHGKCIANVEKFIVDQAAKYADNENIEDGADDQRTENSNGHIPRRIFGFLRCRGDGVKPDIGEENYGRTAAHSGPSILAADTGVGRHERMPVSLDQFRMIEKVMAPHSHKHYQHANLDIDNCSIEVG